MASGAKTSGALSLEDGPSPNHPGPNRLKFHVWSIGCQMNTADARRMSDELAGYGGEAVPKIDDADVVVLYSCVVRQAAEVKVHNELERIRRIKVKRPSMRVALAGC